MVRHIKKHIGAEGRLYCCCCCCCVQAKTTKKICAGLQCSECKQGNMKPSKVSGPYQWGQLSRRIMGRGGGDTQCW